MSKQPIAILLIEDDPGDASLLCFALNRSAGDYDVRHTNQLSSGIALAQTQAYELIVTDLGLPDSHDLEGVERLRFACPNAAIIVLSGEDDERLYLEALSAGADNFLSKNEMTPVTMHRCIQQSLHRVRQSEEIRRLIKASTDQRQQLKEQSLLLASKNQRLQKLCDTSQEFVNNVSHEFRTPLCVVKQYASLIADGVVGPINDEQRKMLNVIEGRVDDLNTIVDDMLDISRHESGLLAASRVACTAKEILDRILPGLQQRAAHREIELLCEMPEDLNSIYCDPEKLSRALINLIVNAIKFSQPNDPIVIKVSQCLVNQELTVAVCDSGPGIEPEQRDLIFARFQQGDTNLRSSTKGFGLGLNIAKDLVNLNLGEMSLQSVVGEGSTFSFTVPMNNPLEISKRYLKRLQSPGNESHTDVQVIRATADPNLTTQSRQEVHKLLNYLLRSNDLLLPISQAEWQLVVNIHREELACFFQRVEHETELLNRNRPQGPLPSLKLETVGEIDLAQAESMLQAMYKISKTATEESETAITDTAAENTAAEITAAENTAAEITAAENTAAENTAIVHGSLGCTALFTSAKRPIADAANTSTGATNVQ